MSVYISKVYEYLDAHPVSRYEGDFQSLLEMLHYIYATCNPVDSEKIREALHQLAEISAPLSLEEDDAVSNLVSGLCYEHEQIAFYHGLVASMHLMKEINLLP